MDAMKALTGNKPERIAALLVRTKFNGLIPEMVTAAECFELMVQFAEYQSQRAELMEKQFLEAVNCFPGSPIIVSPRIPKD